MTDASALERLRCRFLQESTTVKWAEQRGQIAVWPMASFGARTRPVRQYGQTAMMGTTTSFNHRLTAGTRPERVPEY